MFAYDYIQLDMDDRFGTLPDDKAFTYRDFDSSIHSVTARVSFLLGNEPLPPPPLK